MKERAPDVCDFMVAMAVPKVKGNDGTQIIPLATAYSILMNIRCRELSLVQNMNAVLLGTGGAKKGFVDSHIKLCHLHEHCWKVSSTNYMCMFNKHF